MKQLNTVEDCVDYIEKMFIRITKVSTGTIDLFRGEVFYTYNSVHGSTCYANGTLALLLLKVINQSGITNIEDILLKHWFKEFIVDKFSSQTELVIHRKYNKEHP